ncbi:TetR family transcriptional regulator [Streptococcus criceti]|uniref:HTH tetR-type domain-containing protein n=1 Tax=Streptococcus criceti HS-6 TaxID=873449 RepID=G5JP03_STRCG|nr:hypothetical protein STRCR_1534 [Streptococcus criceti HS-6]SUN43413.1 TetR family transcriptional regulator [Streptococcus criceti]
MKKDLRFEKTEKNLQEAFLHLLQAKDLTKISVKEICQLAQVSRNAFYQHYETQRTFIREPPAENPSVYGGGLPTSR